MITALGIIQHSLLQNMAGREWLGWKKNGEAINQEREREKNGEAINQERESERERERERERE
jgi:hypothetical protein